MKVQHIEILVAIAEAGSLRAAAEMLGKSQPALTKSLRQAEENLGIQLFHRSSRGAVLTKMGERVLVRARTISTELGRLNDEVMQLRGEQVGTINVCLSPFAAVKIMPRALALFRQSHPDVQVAMSSGLFPGALKPLREGQTDMIIGPTPPKDMARDFLIEPLLDMPVVVVTSKSSPYANAKSLVELLDAQWITIGAKGAPGDNSRKMIFEDNGLATPKALTTSESYFGALSLVETLGAICTFPKLLLDDVSKSWNIQEIALAEPIPTRPISVMTRQGHPLTPSAAALLNCVRRRAETISRAI